MDQLPELVKTALTAACKSTDHSPGKFRRTTVKGYLSNLCGKLNQRVALLVETPLDLEWKSSPELVSHTVDGKAASNRRNGEEPCGIAGSQLRKKEDWSINSMQERLQAFLDRKRALPLEYPDASQNDLDPVSQKSTCLQVS